VTAIVVTRSRPAAACFEVLAAVDLGADAANLFRRPAVGDASPPWAAPLRLAYQAAPGRLALQVIGLHHATIGELRDALREGPPGLRDAPGHRLATAFAEALRPLTDDPAFDDDAAGHTRRTNAFVAEALEDLTTLRAALWETRPQAMPRLTILDCPALGLAGRATTAADGGHVVAVNLGAGPEHALMQILHEQVHPVTDPLVVPSLEGRTTEVGTPGFATHARVERVAIDVGAALVDARAPHLRDAYARWAARFGDA
jgi:hypothetical protein